jgi:glycosyltransferase involved in cell wall biosynthesis
MKVLFLYTELAEYFIRCCQELSARCEVHIVRWPVNPEAPFRFTIPAQINVYNRQEMDLAKLQQLADKINPDIIICSGWIDKDYLKVTRKFFRKIPCVIALDTRWEGKLRQYIAVVFGRMALRRIFTHAWVPGNAQSRYATMLGFPQSRIHKGFYCCDLPRFNEIYRNTRAGKELKFPKRFIYTGRYYAFKGAPELWQAFIEIKNETGSNWELWCMGQGDLKPVVHDSIRHLGFVQPADLENILKDCSVFILPSRFEPWGVVVHEFAAAGFPLLLSDAVGAGEALLDEGQNGFSFEAGSKEMIKLAVKKIMNISDKDLLLMGQKSHERAQRISLVQWADTVTQIISGFRKN